VAYVPVSASVHIGHSSASAVLGNSSICTVASRQVFILLSDARNRTTAPFVQFIPLVLEAVLRMARALAHSLQDVRARRLGKHTSAVRVPCLGAQSVREQLLEPRAARLAQLCYHDRDFALLQARLCRILFVRRARCACVYKAFAMEHREDRRPARCIREYARALEFSLLHINPATVAFPNTQKPVELSRHGPGMGVRACNRLVYIHRAEDVSRNYSFAGVHNCAKRDCILCHLF